MRVRGASRSPGGRNGALIAGSPSVCSVPRVEVSLPARIDSEIDRLVDEGEFINRDRAIEGLIATGISVHDTGSESPAEMDEDVFTQALDDQQDPALDRDRHDPDRAP